MSSQKHDRAGAASAKQREDGASNQGHLSRSPSTSPITRELIEHYLRATWWEQNPAISSCGAWSADRGSTRHVIAIDDVELAIRALAKADGKTVRERLGLCAAAEAAFAEASLWEPSDPRAGYEGTERETIMNLGRTLLQMASIDPELWDKARR